VALKNNMTFYAALRLVRLNGRFREVCAEDTMVANRDRFLAFVVLLAMVFFIGVQCMLVAKFAQDQWQLVHLPQTIVKKVAVDYGGTAFAYTVQTHSYRNGTGIVLGLLYLAITVAAIFILWSATRGALLRQRNVTASWLISVSLLLTLPLHWSFARSTQIIEAYDKAAASGKAIVTFMSLPIKLDLYPFLAIGLALTFSIVLRQAILMKMDLDGTI
jgi:hypothetical protein